MCMFTSILTGVIVLLNSFNYSCRTGRRYEKMNTEESKKVDKEVLITRRAAIKAGWAVPIILAIGLNTGNVFARASNNGNPQNNGNGNSNSGTSHNH